MDGNNRHSGLHSAARAGWAAGAAYRIMHAASIGGVKGAAAATVKEAWPLLIKLALALIVALLLIPMLLLSALPNIFFGFDSSQTQAVTEMTQKALAIGGAYVTLSDFERTHVDSIVTSLTAEYEAEGETIDRIEVISSMREEDLLWLIAINSAAHQQNLHAMSAEDIRAFCVSSLTLTPSLGFAEGGEDGSVTTLRVEVKRLDPGELMDSLGFDDEARNWAGALYEMMEESDALNQHADYFAQYRPVYGGDTSYTGDVLYGGEYGNEIDISGFTDPTTKNNLDLAAYAIQAWENNWGYVWGTFGNILTPSLLAYKLEQYPDGVGSYEDYIRKNWLGRRTADCVGLIKGYGWLDSSDLTIGYGENGMPDYGANQMYQASVKAGTSGVDYGPMDAMPEIVGLAVWKEGHIGVYIGNGQVIEAMSTKRGVVKTEVSGRGWEGWCKLPYIEYITESGGSYAEGS